MTQPTGNANRIEHEIEDGLTHGHPLRSTVHEEVHKLRQLDSNGGRLNRHQFQTDLREIDHALHQKHLLPHLHIVSYGRHLGQLVHDAHDPKHYDQHAPHHDPQHPAHPGYHPHSGHPHYQPQEPNSASHRQHAVLPPSSPDTAGNPEPSQLNPVPQPGEQTPYRPAPRTPHQFVRPPVAEAPPAPSPGMPPGATAEIPHPVAPPPAPPLAPEPLPEPRPEPRPERDQASEQPDVPRPQDIPPASDAAVGQLATLKSAIERARTGGRPLTIAQIGDSHIKFGTETPALASRLAQDSGLQAGQIEYSSFGDVSKTASYANDHPEEFLRNINQNTDLVVVSFGSNEAGAQAGSKYTSDYTQLISKIRQKAPQAAIVMVGPTDGDFWNTSRHLPYLGSVTQAQENVAARVSDSAYIDVGPQMGSVSSMLSRNLMRTDNLHLTTAGYQLLGSTIADDIEAVLNKQTENLTS